MSELSYSDGGVADIPPSPGAAVSVPATIEDAAILESVERTTAPSVAPDACPPPPANLESGTESGEQDETEVPAPVRTAATKVTFEEEEAQECGNGAEDPSPAITFPRDWVDSGVDKESPVVRESQQRLQESQADSRRRKRESGAITATAEPTVWGRYEDGHFSAMEYQGDNDSEEEEVEEEEALIEAPYMLGCSGRRMQSGSTRRLFTITIVEADGLDALWHSWLQGAPNIFVEMLNGEDEVCITPKAMNTRAPKWNKTTYLILFGPENPENFTFTLNVYDYFSLWPVNLLGRATFALAPGTSPWVEVADITGAALVCRVHLTIEEITRKQSPKRPAMDA